MNEPRRPAVELLGQVLSVTYARYLRDAARDRLMVKGPRLTATVDRTWASAAVDVLDQIAPPSFKVQFAAVLCYEDGRGLAWHRDGEIDPERTWLGLTVALSDPDEYEGGEFIVENFDIGKSERYRLGCGEGVVIRGDIDHAVRVVTSGTRWLLAAFATDGPPGIAPGPVLYEASSSSQGHAVRSFAGLTLGLPQRGAPTR